MDVEVFLKRYIQEGIQTTKKSLSQLVFEGLRQAIIKGQLPIGERINEKLYAEVLNISRTPIREALARLEEENLVEHRPQVGTIVKQLTARDINEIYQIRKALDYLASYNAAKKMSEVDFNAFEQILHDSEMAHRQNDLPRVTACFSAFNAFIFEHAEMPRLNEILHRLREYLTRFRDISMSGVERRRRALDGHWVIYYTMRHQKFAELQRAIAKHLDESEIFIRQTVLEETKQDLKRVHESQSWQLFHESMRNDSLTYKVGEEDQIQFQTELAVNSLIREVVLWPKPGLVDAKDNGAHTDMTVTTFTLSSVTLAPFFKRMAREGYVDHYPKRLFSAIREIGIEAEQAMFQAVGVNTHKGAIFSLGIFVAATASVLRSVTEILHLERSLPVREYDDIERSPYYFVMTRIFGHIAEMLTGLLEADWTDLERQETLSAGERIYLQYGIAGVRGEAEAGYPVIRQGSFPLLFKERKRHPKTAELRVLLYLMSVTQDTNVIHRGGMDSYNWLRARADTLYHAHLTDEELLVELEGFNQECIARNVSPGGAADLLSVTLYLEQIFMHLGRV